MDFKRIEFGNKPTGTPQATLAFDTTVQPIFHKNFDLVSTSFTDYQKRGYTLYICTDSEKQAKRLKDIFEERGDHIVHSVNKTLHEGFTDNVLKRLLLQTIRFLTVSINTIFVVTRRVAVRWH